MINKREKGNIGEDIACTFLRKNGFIVANRNYYKKWGELDIVTKKGNELHFFEVKSVVVRNYAATSFSILAEGQTKTFHNPEENVNAFKVKQLRKIIQTYLVEKGYGLDYDFHFHILCVYMNEKTRRARVKWIKNVIL